MEDKRKAVCPTCTDNRLKKANMILNELCIYILNKCRRLNTYSDSEDSFLDLQKT